MNHVLLISDSSVLVDRSRVTLTELLGVGQFGNVYRGTFVNEVLNQLGFLSFWFLYCI